MSGWAGARCACGTVCRGELKKVFGENGKDYKKIGKAGRRGKRTRGSRWGAKYASKNAKYTLPVLFGTTIH